MHDLSSAILRFPVFRFDKSRLTHGLSHENAPAIFQNPRASPARIPRLKSRVLRDEE